MSASADSCASAPKRAWRGVIHAYRSYLPVDANTPIVTLHEGNTPLIHSEVLSRRVGCGAEVYLKYEGMNPTGSFKDRGMTLAISKALEEGAVAVMCASTGNTSASASAYAARCGLRSIVLIPNGAIALGKLSQALIHNAVVIPVEANFDRCLQLVKDLVDAHPIALVNSINRYRIEGQKTCAFEICDALGKAPDYNLTPVGNAGNITAQWQGYREYCDGGRVGSLPAMLGFQASGADPIVRGEIVPNPETVATAIRIGNPASWKGALAAASESGGAIDSITDAQILSAYRALAQEDGIFVEPASAASVAGLIAYAEKGFFKDPLRAKENLSIVCVVTGHGLKDPQCAISNVKLMEPVSATFEAVCKAARL